MKDWNSLTHDRYYEDHQSNNQVGIGILNISRDIKNEFVLGYGLDYKELGRTLQEIFKLKIDLGVNKKNVP